MITKYGEICDSLLEKRVIVVDNENERTTRTEYWFRGEEVRSDLDIYLKKGISLEAIKGAL